MEQRIEVRSLEGHSIVVSISPDRSIGDLKALLKESFLPAKNSPDFHLFFKGAKLSLESRIDAHKMEHGEFMVLVPFAKKKRQFSMLNDHPEHSTDPMESSCQRVMSPAAKSAWYDIMSDLESLSEVLPSDPMPSNCISGDKVVASEASSGQSLNAKCRREPKSNHALHDILSSGSMNVFEQETCHRIRAVVESVGCLSNGSTGRCSLFQEFFRAADGVEQCMCPEWLKRVVKMFTFLNIFYAFFHMQHKIVPWDCLEETLKQGGRFGLDDVCVSDVESLSLLCPKVVVMLRKEKNKTNKLASQIIVGDCSTELTDQSESVNKHMTARKPVRTSATINAVERRGTAFKSQLWKVVRSSMENSPSKCSKPAMLTLEDLLSIEDGITVVNGRKAKSVKCTSLASGCHDVNELETTGMVKHLRKGIGMLGQIVHVEEIAAKLPVYVEIPENLSEITKATLKGGGISRLYSHQAESIKVSLSGKNVVVATSTSSGKSLCYNIPVIEALTQNLSSCALYIFPTKALAQDQLRALLEMTRGFDIGLHVGVYDGDTSQEQRIWIRDNIRLLITNPDMLHMSILPYHGRFQRILSNLRYIVIDETHTYKGAFGCHTALILRRLQRICSHVYSSDASFIFCTATSANPREHAMELANLKNLELIQNDGSPCGPKHFILWNPPLCMGSKTLKGRIEHKSVNRDAITRRSSPIMEVSCLFAEMVQHGLRCITFCKTRKLSELVLCYTREILQETAPNLVDSVRVYRAGYIPEDRRKIEADLFGGKLRGVAATNALELGIDVGHIDATLHLGFPGSIASLWQQAGRSGRRARPSLAVYVAFEGPLDQYFMKFPHKLFQGPIEHCQVDAYNQKVLEQHVACAAFELPLCKHYDEEHFGSGLDNAIMALRKKGCIGFDPVGVSSPERWIYIGPEQSPSHAISIRAIETVKYLVVDKSGNEVLEEIEESRAFFQVYEGAVYMHQGITYLVKDLDLSAKIAFCEKADLKYYTKTRDYTDIHVIGGDLAYPPVNASEIEHVKTTAQTNACTVTTKWFGFHRIWKTDNRIFETVELNLPSYSYESQAAWIRVPQSIKSAVEIQEISFRAGQHAASHALLNVVPLYMMCNSSDLSTECANPHETRNIPERILLYEQHPGGIGLSAQIQMLFRELLTAALELVTTCSCFGDAGCPNCVQSLSCSEYNEVINKRAAIIILKGVIEAENSYFKSRKGSSELNHNN